MLTIEKVDTNSKKQVNEFVKFQYDLYKDTPQFCPPFISDIKMMLDRKKHPFYEHSDADFFIARRDGKMVGRIAVMENRPFNTYHKTTKAQFYLLDMIDDLEVSTALFNAASEWAHARGLTELVGPKGFNAFDGYGILVEGFEEHQMMTMMNYNFDYYPKLMEAMGFEKEVDFVSCYIPCEKFIIPERAKEVARRVEERGTLKVKNFKNKRELLQWADRVGDAYNKVFVNNWEYYPLSKREIKALVDSLMVVLDYRLIKIITHNDDLVGFLLGFPDISAALKRGKGRITPWSIVDMLLCMKNTKWISLNGAGVLPEYHGRGGNALLYAEMEKALANFGFDHGELTQVAETAVQMRKDLISMGGRAYKNHRIFHKAI